MGDGGYNIYHKPADRFVAMFIGQGTKISGRVLADERIELLCLVQSHHDHGIGERIGVRLVVDHVAVFPV
jgi:iron(III) transport system ATP-binding protein